MRPALLLVLLPAALTAQTPAAPKPPVHRAAAAGTLPPNIPKVVGIPRTAYSLRYIDTKLGTGPIAAPSILGTSQADSKIMFYTVQYTGWLAKDGKKFDSSFDHPGKEPITFPFGVRRVIPGWDTGFDGMRIGGKRRLFIPYQLAYGDSGKPPAIPAKSDLIFDIELMGVSDQPPAQQTAPPAAQRPAPSAPPAPPAPRSPAAPPQPATPSPAEKPMTDPATNDPAKATTPDNAAPKPGTKPPTP